MDLQNVPYELVEARTCLLTRCVFFSVIMYEQCEVVYLDQPDADGKFIWRGMEIPTACTDGRHLVFNGDFFRSLSLNERIFVMAHEIYHAMAMHTKRMKYYYANGLCGFKFIPELYNVAADAVINQCLVQDGIGTMPKMGVLYANGIKSKDGNSIYTVTGLESPEIVYEKLIEHCEDDPNGGGEGEGDGDGGGGGEGKGQQAIDNGGGQGDAESDLKMPDTATDSQINEIEMKASIQSAAQQAKSRGQMPGGLKSFIDEFLEPEVNWEEELRASILKSSVPDSYTWNKPNRRKLLGGMYTPRRIGTHCGHVVCAIDTSGSVSDRELMAFLGELSSILGDVRPEKMTIIWCDSQVDAVDEVEEPEELRDLVRVNGVYGRGGTSFVPPFEYTRDNIDDAAFFIYLTDMYAPFPEPDLIDCPVIWVASSDVVAPFGTTIQIEVK